MTERAEPTESEKAAATSIISLLEGLDVEKALNVLSNVASAIIATLEPEDHVETIDNFVDDLYEFVPGFHAEFLKKDH